MKVLVIGSDPRIFDVLSENFSRMRSYAELFDQLHIVSPAPADAKNNSFGNLFLWPIIPSTYALWWWHAYRTAVRVGRARGIDIVDAQDAGESGLAGLLVSRALGVPLRIQIHTDIMSPWYRCASGKEYLRCVMARFLIPRASCLRVVSERIKRSILESGMMKDGSKITVLPIFTDVSRFLTARPDDGLRDRFGPDPFIMLAAGRFRDREKNFSMLIDMMSVYIRVCPRAVLVLVGEGPDREQYASRIRHLGLEEHVILEPWHDDLSRWYASCDLFLLPSYFEGWGRAVIEAMASGCAVVMTDVGMAGDVVKNGENGIVVRVAGNKEFFEACRELWEHPEKRAMLARSARDSVRTLAAHPRSEYLSRYKACMESCTRP